MSADGPNAVHPGPVDAKPGQAKYAPVSALQETPAPGPWRKRTLLAATILGTAAAVAFHSRSHSFLPWSSGGTLGLEGVERSCLDMPGVRLDNGAGDYSDATVKTSDECVAKCRVNDRCAQLIFSSENGGCYMFGEATSKLYSEDDGSDVTNFHSAFCGLSSEALDLQVLRSQVERALEKEELKLVRSQWAVAEKKARKFVDAMDLDTKMAFVSGHDGGMGYAGFLKPSGLPEGVMNLKMQDGPQGFNPYQEILAGTATQFPSLLALAASFSPDVSKAYGSAVADEFVTKGSNVLLGPDVEVTRATLSGRCFETLSGEDPFLGSQLVKPYIQMVQARGIIATVKHWLDNNQEIYRQTMTSVVGERANHEIYMPVFRAAFEAGAGAVMCAYNKVNGQHACESKHLLTDLLRDELGFKGYVVSDWGATHDAEKSANTGLDVEMPKAKHMKDIPKLISSGQVAEETLNTMATHVISAMEFVGQFDGRFPADKAGALGHLPATTDEHRAIALNTIIESTVLLKNIDATLPLKTAGKTIALIGQYCNKFKDKSFAQGDVFAGGGSGFVITDRTVTPRQGVEDHVKDVNKITWSADVSAAKGADIALVCVSAHAEEGWDRDNLTVPEAHDLLSKLRKQPGGKEQKIIMLVVVPGAVETDWIKDADAALLMFGPGEQVGVAFAQLLSGEATPRGRLPVSFPEVGEKRFTPYQYPGLCEGDQWCEGLIANFSEDVLVGYRWNIAKKVSSAFPFGFGLTYSDFAFDDIQATCSNGTATVTMKVTNHGHVDDVAVPQIYVGFPSLAPVVNQLRGFQKLQIAPGDIVDVVFILQEEDWSYYDEKAGKWTSAAEKGEQITVSIGSSSADLPLQSTFSCGVGSKSESKTVSVK